MFLIRDESRELSFESCDDKDFEVHISSFVLGVVLG